MKLGQILTANRRISNIEPQNVEVWNRCAQSFFYKIDRIPSFDIRYSSTPRRGSIFAFSKFLFWSDQLFFSRRPRSYETLL